MKSIHHKVDQLIAIDMSNIKISKEIVGKNLDKLYKIPIYTKHVRSLNLANAVSIVVYEGLRNFKHG